jgi:flagellar biogenesis protein FliO
MLFPVVFLPLAAVLINDAKTDVTDRAMVVDIATSEPVSSDEVRGISGGPHRMYIYLNNTVASQRAFGGGPDPIVVHPRARYTKLEIPTPTRCSEPVSIEQTPSGIRVRASCRDPGPSASATNAPLRVRVGDSAERPKPDAPRAAMVRGRVHEELLRAALVLPPEAAATENLADATGGDGDEHAATTGRGKGEPVKGVAGTAAQAGKVPVNAGPAALVGAEAPVATAAPPDAPTAALVGSNDSSSTPPATGPGKDGKSGSSVASMFLAVALLVGLGVAAAVFARRRVKGSRMIRIVETASIGPKRSLVVACIGGRTMVLGVSEAGVSLLDSQGASSIMPEVPATLPAVDSDIAAGLRHRAFGEVRGDRDSSHEDQNEDKNESSLLSRLFQRPKRASEEASRSRDFEGLLSESLEDEELRRKLSLGEAGRVA